MTLEDEAEVIRHLGGMKAGLVSQAESLVRETEVHSDPEFGKRQMVSLLSIAEAERCPEVLSAWIKGQIGKGRDTAWGRGFGERALKVIEDLRGTSSKTVAGAGGRLGNLEREAAERELWIRSTILFFGYARWEMLYQSALGGARGPSARQRGGPSPGRNREGG